MVGMKATNREATHDLEGKSISLKKNGALSTQPTNKVLYFVYSYVKKESYLGY
jgi:hypothetical protein